MMQAYLSSTPYFHTALSHSFHTVCTAREQRKARLFIPCKAHFNAVPRACLLVKTTSQPGKRKKIKKKNCCVRCRSSEKEKGRLIFSACRGEVRPQPQPLALQPTDKAVWEIESSTWDFDMLRGRKAGLCTFGLELLCLGFSSLCFPSFIL